MPKQEQWFHDQPKPTSPAALDKVIEMASVATGMLEAEEADDWREWLRLVHVQLRGGLDATDKAKVIKMGAVLRKISNLTDEFRGARGCGVCGKTGHNRQTCPLAKGAP